MPKPSPRTKMKFYTVEQLRGAIEVREIQYDVQLASNITRERIRAGMTQEKLAKKIGVLQPAIARAENGRVPPTHNLLKKIAKALKVRLVPPDLIAPKSRKR